MVKIEARLVSKNEVTDLFERLAAASLGSGPNDGTVAMAGCFIMCWSKFELLCLDDLGTAQPEKSPPTYQESIENFCKLRIAEDADFSPFQASYDYFRERYHTGDDFVVHFTALIEKDGHAKAAIERIFDQEPRSTADKVQALLLVAYRMRGNLVHGNKWQTGLDDQLRNFFHASSVLLGTLEHFSVIAPQIRR